jgi:hypothetical protein
VTDTPNTTETTVDARGGAHADVIAWLEGEFPGWSVSVDETATWEGDLKPLWIARRDGHHPQAELTAAKLHTRLTQHLEREARRTAFSN